MFLGESVEGDGGDDVLLEAHQLQDGARDEEVRLPRVAALHVEVCHHAAEPGAVGGVQKVVARLGISVFELKHLQGDQATGSKPPVDIKTKAPL